MWFLPALIGGAAATVGAVLTRNDNKKEAARVAAANKAEAARVQKENKAEAARVEQVRKQEQKEAIADNTKVRENYYKNVVSDAQSAGINPLTALRTGAGSGYGSTVQGTIRQPVMRDGVYLEGVYQTPTLSRNPLDVGLSTATSLGMSEMTRLNSNAHDVRMAKLRGQIDRANALSINKATSNEIDYNGLSKVPVSFGHLDFHVPVEIAKRLRIAPNDQIEAGVIQELFGESSELFTTFAQGAFEEQMGINTWNLLFEGKNKNRDPNGRPQVTTKVLKDPFMTRIGNLLSGLDMRLP